MKKHTLIENIKIDAHTYLVTIGTDLGQFTGVVECREEDWQYESPYFGYGLAELKAEIEYARAKRKYYDAELKALTQFWRDMAHTRTYNVDAYWVKKLRQKVDAISEQREYWAKQIKARKEAYHFNIVTFDTLKNSKIKIYEDHNND